MEPPKVYTRKEVAALLRVQPKTVTYYVCQGKLPKPIVKGRWSASQITEWIQFGTWTERKEP